MTVIRYDMLEVLFDHAPASDPMATLSGLQDLLEPRFELEPLELVGREGIGARRRQVVRIAAIQGEAFESAAAMDAELREIAGAAAAWARIGAIRAGQVPLVRS